jgi:ribosomal RNA-processing protein 8
LNKKKYEKLVIADLGCGEAYLAQNLKQKIYSFDLVKYNDYITKCDLKNIPLEDFTVSIGVFCLSLMGTNFVDFIVEAKRILKDDGILIVCEITSRIISLDNFLNTFKAIGFKLRKQIDIKNYFTLFVFRLSHRLNRALPTENSNEILKPCLYKRR